MTTSPLITVLGATGTIGTDLVPRLLATGTTVRAVTRDPARRIPGAQRVIADIRDPGTLRPALAGADALFLNSPSSEDAAAQQIWAADLAHELGISRLVLLSQYGARTDSPVRFLRWHGEVEQHVRSLGIDHTVLRPNLYLQSLLGLAETISRGRSEERRVGKECRSRGWREHSQRKSQWLEERGETGGRCTC